MTDTWHAAFARKVAEVQAEADATSAADLRDDATVFAEVVAEMGADVRPWLRQWVRERIGDRVPTRAELWVLLDIVPTEDEEDEDEALDRTLAYLDLGHAAEARQQLRAEWNAIDSDFTTAEFFDELVRRGALSAEQAKRELAFIETWGVVVTPRTHAGARAMPERIRARLDAALAKVAAGHLG